MGLINWLKGWQIWEVECYSPNGVKYIKSVPANKESDVETNFKKRFPNWEFLQIC